MDSDRKKILRRSCKLHLGKYFALSGTGITGLFVREILQIPFLILRPRSGQTKNGTV
jgi:hypothetical protein